MTITTFLNLRAFRRILFFCGLTVFALPPGLVQAQSAGLPPVIWDRRVGGADNEELSAAVATADGGYLLAGTSESGATGDRTQPSQGQRDYWAMKVDAAGNRQWDRRYGGTDHERLATALPTADGGYLLAGTTYSNGTGDMTQPSQGDGDYWVVKLDATGAKQWDRRFGGNFDDELYSAIQTADGGYLLAGATTSDVTGDLTQPGKGLVDGWAVKIDAAGIKQWNQRLGGANRDGFLSAIQTADGGYLLGGGTSSAVSGDVSQPNRGDVDYWIVKTDVSGVKLWDQRFGGDNQDALIRILQTADGGFLLSGTSPSAAGGDKTQPNHGSGNTGLSDYWVVKTDAAGTKLWDRRYGGTNDDFLTGVCPAPNGGYVLAGWSRSGASADKTQPSQGRDDYWLVRIDGGGTQLWDQRMGGLGDDVDPRVVPLPAGGYLVAGTSDSGTSGNKTQPSQGLRDFWAVRLGAELLATTPPRWSAAVEVYPNPAHGAATVRLPGREAGANSASLTLFDAVGRTLLRQRAMLGATAGIAALPLDNVANGLYLLRVQIGRETVVRRVEVR
ncbi:MAG TPA: T9SS type A sorting domain-containing protein [Hymenobacter sp.]|jgi:hypothetical protein|uniref:T9SS type A sorting domain-containing protein n=1 Tax=Hymenobacter sp. TaxID=1898978 RepID=UPI002ED85185